MTLPYSSERPPLDAARLWAAYRRGHLLSCDCGRPLALVVGTQVHQYRFQCVGCAWQSRWFAA